MADVSVLWGSGHCSGNCCLSDKLSCVLGRPSCPLSTCPSIFPDTPWRILWFQKCGTVIHTQGQVCPRLGHYVWLHPDFPRLAGKEERRTSFGGVSSATYPVCQSCVVWDALSTRLCSWHRPAEGTLCGCDLGAFQLLASHTATVDHGAPGARQSWWILQAPP